MKRLEVTVVSLRVGQIRLDDIAPQIGDSPNVEVVVVDLAGVVQHVQLTFTEKWATRGWHRVLQCSLCQSPARVLHVEGGSGLCHRCCPRLTVSQRYRNNRSWTRADELLDQLIRSLLKGPAKALNIRHRRVALRITKHAIAQVSNVIDRARVLVVSFDTLLASQSDMREMARLLWRPAHEEARRNAPTITTLS